MNRPTSFLAILFATPVSLWAGPSFEKDVVPILERRCLGCHNDGDEKGDFSLQSRRTAFADGYLEPGKPAESHLLDLVTPTDGKAAMPKGGEPLSAAELKVLRDWIDAGATWPDGVTLEPSLAARFDWWSYRPLKRPEVPSVGDGWGRNPVDAFVLRRLRQNDLGPSPEADRRTLIRRLQYDLTGLPPSPEEVAAFVADPAPDAYERLVERLLASPRYGERWARHWLDVVKYADTHGYDKDKLRANAWPYRDYVVRSLNEDKPYARFVREQVAGDVLFPGEPDGVLGLGFLAAGPWDFIGHVEVPESKIDGKVARNLDRDDMVSNVLNTFCGVTVQCARCHDHPFDPITQEQYYGLQSVFAALDRADRPYDLDPDVPARRRRLEQQLASSQKELAAVERAVAAAAGPRLVELEKQIAALGRRVEVRKEPAFGYHSRIEKRNDVAKWVGLEFPQPVDVSKVVLHPCHDEYAGVGAGFGFPVRYRIEVSRSVGPDAAWTTVVDRSSRDEPGPGLTPVAFDVELQGVRRLRVHATKLVERKDDFILALAELKVFGPAGDGGNVAAGATVRSLDSIEAPPRWRRTNLVDGLWARPADPAAAKQLAAATRERDERLARAGTPERVAERSRLRERIAETQAELRALPVGAKVYAATTHFPKQGSFRPTEGRLRPIHLLHRGDVTRPGEPVVPGALPLGPDDAPAFDASLDEGERRVALADWLVRPDHPLVWRTMANRVWQYHLGAGLVASPNDFGHMGARPSHPELLDWLACELRDTQSLKRLHRLVVTSDTYRQASRHDEAFAAVDGENRFLWRANRRRLSAEEIRDSVLSASGSLDDRMGGPGYFLFALEKTAHSPHFQYHRFDPAEPASHRRSVYRFVVRSQPNPWMSTLDCADSSQSTPRRNETLTSLQALALLNNRFNLEMSRRFAARLEREEPTTAGQVERAVQLVLQRRAGEQERSELAAYAEEHGLANLCRLLFNLNEFVYLD